jgi:hypothetical protein
MNSPQGVVATCARSLPWTSEWAADNNRGSYDKQNDRTVSIDNLGRAANQEWFFLMRKAFEDQDSERGKDSKVGVMQLKGGNAQLTDDSTRTQS